MRTTLNLDDDVLNAVKSYAGSRSIPLGEAVSMLVRRGLSVPCPTRKVNGLLVFAPPPGEPLVTSKQVRELEDEL
jgi:hypothetical protein